MGIEKKLERRCTDIAKAKDWWTRKFVSPSNRGVPDRIFIRKGDVLFIEFKAPGNDLSPLQADCIDRMQTHGANVYVVDSVDKFKALLKLFNG